MRFEVTELVANLKIVDGKRDQQNNNNDVEVAGQIAV